MSGHGHELEGCHFCDAPAPVDDCGDFRFFVYGEGRRSLEPSCAGHATHGCDGKLIDWRQRDDPNRTSPTRRRAFVAVAPAGRVF